MTDDHLAVLTTISTTILSDALDGMGFDGTLSNIAPLTSKTTRIAGPARTVLQGKRRPTADRKTVLTRHAAFVDNELRAGDIVVVSTPDDVSTSTWGYLLSVRCASQGVAGTVINGSVRDRGEIQKLRYPVFARIDRQSPAGSKYRLETLGVDVPVMCGGIVIEAGDIIVADENGVVVCPKQLLERVIAAAKKIADGEESTLERINRGGKLSAPG